MIGSFLLELVRCSFKTLVRGNSTGGFSSPCVLVSSTCSPGPDSMAEKLLTSVNIASDLLGGCCNVLSTVCSARVLQAVRSLKEEQGARLGLLGPL